MNQEQDMQLHMRCIEIAKEMATCNLMYPNQIKLENVITNAKKLESYIRKGK